MKGNGGGGGGGVRDKKVPYKILLERINIEIELCWLLVELFFMVIYFGVFISYIIIEMQITTAYEVNGYIHERFAESTFPGGEFGEQPKRFGEISSPNDFLKWFDNVALPTVFQEFQLSTSSEQIPVFQCYLWQKQVKPSNTHCVEAPGFLWQSVNKMNGLDPSSTQPLCYPAYSDNDENKDPVPFFHYNSTSPISSNILVGQLTSEYSSGGYYSGAINAEWMETWPPVQVNVITSATRLMALQGVAYFPSYNFWAKFMMAVEFSNTGEVYANVPEIISGQIDTCNALYSCGLDIVLLSLGSLTAVFVLLHLLLFLAFRIRAVQRVLFSMTERMSAGKRVRRMLWDFCGFYVLADLAQVVLGLITLTYISQTLWQPRTAENIPLDQTPLDTKYVAQISSALARKNSMSIVFGLQVLLFNIQVFKYFPALPCFTLPRRAWEVACKDVFKVFIVYLLAILAFSFSGWLAFNNQLFYYSSFELALNSAVQAILGEISFFDAAIEGSASVFLWFFYLFFITIFMYILQALFLSAVLDGFRVAFKENEGREFFTEFAEKFLCCCCRQRGGDGGGGGGKMAINFGAMSKEEVDKRLRDWKMRKANEDLTLISWTQLRDALRGFTHNHLDVSDEEVDSIFRLVDIVHFVQVKKTRNGLEQAEGEEDGEEDKMPANATEVVNTMMQVKADEQEFVRKVNAMIQTLTAHQVLSEDSLKRAVEVKLAAKE